MCVIMGFAPGTMPEKEHIKNAVWNNWHSWGLILKDGNNKLQVLKDCPDSGEVDPELIWKMLEDNKDIERTLHLRHNTRGATNLDNAQPFSVYSDNEFEIHFMHNGTLHQFGDTHNMADAKSDTRDFCNKVLIPALSRWVGPLGKADYTDELFWKCVMERPWSVASKGLFVSDKYPTLAVGDGWEKYNQGKNGDITTSNDLYFRTLQRGPEFERQKKQREDEAAAKQAALFRERQDTFPANNGGERTKGVFGITGSGIKVYNPLGLEKSPELISALNHIHEDINFNDDEEITKSLFALTIEEISQFIEEENSYTTAALFSRLSEAAYSMLVDKQSALRDIDRKNDYIKRLRAELKSLEEDKGSEAA